MKNLKTNLKNPMKILLFVVGQFMLQQLVHESGVEKMKKVRLLQFQ